jgi:hypothetical protein
MINRKEYNYDIAGLVEGIAELKADYISSMSDICNDISDLESDVANEDINDDTMSHAILELENRFDALLALANDQGETVNQMDERIFDMDERVSSLVEEDELSGLVSDILGDEVNDFVADYVCNNDIASRDDVHEIVAWANDDQEENTCMNMRDVAKDAILDYLPVYFDQMMAERKAKSLLGRLLAFSNRIHWRMPCR